jgi:hypothetical protein
MCIAIVLATVGVGLILLGVKGFSAEGIPWSAEKTLKGNAGRVVGIICILLGSLIALAALWLIVKMSNTKR